MFLDVDLNFNPGANDPLNKDDLLSEARAKLMAERARNIEKSLPPFNYDITPREERSIQVDKQFLEVFRLVCRQLKIDKRRSTELTHIFFQRCTVLLWLGSRRSERVKLGIDTAQDAA
jgi:hypothetical protein